MSAAIVAQNGVTREPGGGHDYHRPMTPAFPRLVALVVVSVAGLSSPASAVTNAVPADPAPAEAGISILFIGNSHTRANDLPTMVATLVEADGSGRSVDHEVAPGYQFLDDRLGDPASIELLASRNWTHVVLQAQRYSASGTVAYSTAEAEEWVRRVRAAGAVPIMFPEWPRRGIDESDRIFELHVSIAEAEPVCVPPIPQAFDRAIESVSPLHASDGNHASPSGSLLAALVIAHTMTGQRPESMPELNDFDVDAVTQRALRSAADDAVAATSPWTHCPDDRPASAVAPHHTRCSNLRRTTTAGRRLGDWP